MPSNVPMQENFLPFNVPEAGRDCQTWYMVIGSLAEPQTPLVALHGGPGACHEYLLPLQDIYNAHKIPIILYDQLGNGKSTRIPEKAGVQSFWTEELFRKELNNLLEHLGLHDRGFDLFGQSWGGMLACKVAALQPRGLRKLILQSVPASMELMMKSTAALRRELPEDVQEAMKRCEETGLTDSDEYETASIVFYKKHVCRLEQWPAELITGFGHLKEDPTVYGTMNGPSEFTVTGNLKDWTAIDQLHRIEASTLLINGRYDEVNDAAMQPFFDKIGKVKWITLEDSSHMSHLEQRDRFMEILGQFLTSKS